MHLSTAFRDLRIARARSSSRRFETLVRPKPNKQLRPNRWYCSNREYVVAVGTQSSTLTPSPLPSLEFLYGKYFIDTRAAYDYLLETRAMEDMVDSQAAADRKDRHTIRGRKFRYVEDDEVNHRQSKCPGVAGSSSCYYFDGLKGRRNGATVLVFGELSHFCEKCFAGEFAKDSEGRLTGTPDCDGWPDVYVYNEVIHVPTDAVKGRSSVNTEATRVRSARALEFLKESGAFPRAEPGDWVLIRIGDSYGVDGQSERDLELQGRVAPVQLVDGHDVDAEGGIKATKINQKGLQHSNRLCLRTYVRCEVVEKERRYKLESLEVCDDGTCEGSDGGCSKRHAVRSALESVVSRPFKMVGSPASAASSASSASSSSLGAVHTFVLPPGVVQAGRAVVAADAFAFDASCLV